MMLSLVSPYRTDVFLARIVIPFSRSRSVESITRSATSCPERNAPDCQSMASTSVVFPWSTWAMIATLRRSERRGMGRGIVGGHATEPGGSHTPAFTRREHSHASSEADQQLGRQWLAKTCEKNPLLSSALALELQSIWER